MRRTPTLLGVALVAAATASAVAVTSGSAQAPAGTTLTFVEHELESQSVVADAPPLNTKRQFFGRGDTAIFPSDVLDATGRTKAGRLAIRCTFEKVTPRFRGSRAICDGAYALKDGQLTIQAYVTFDPGKPITFAVTGGTGAYAGVHGSGVNTPRTVEGTVSDTVITLVS
jgi:hypothetical protein